MESLHIRRCRFADSSGSRGRGQRQPLAGDTEQCRTDAETLNSVVVSTLKTVISITPTVDSQAVNDDIEDLEGGGCGYN